MRQPTFLRFAHMTWAQTAARFSPPHKNLETAQHENLETTNPTRDGLPLAPVAGCHRANDNLAGQWTIDLNVLDRQGLIDGAKDGSFHGRLLLCPLLVSNL